MRLFERAALAVIFLAAWLIMGQASYGAIGPEPAPQCKARKHCKVKWDHRPYVYRSYVTITETVNGITITYRFPTRCTVNPRTGNTWCVIQ